MIYYDRCNSQDKIYQRLQRSAGKKLVRHFILQNLERVVLYDVGCVPSWYAVRGQGAASLWREMCFGEYCVQSSRTLSPDGHFHVVVYPKYIIIIVVIIIIKIVWVFLWEGGAWRIGVLVCSTVRILCLITFFLTCNIISIHNLCRILKKSLVHTWSQ